MTQYIEAIRAHALENYEMDGWDFLVECWEDHDIAETIEECKTLDEAIAKCKRIVSMLNERREEVRSEADYGDY